MLKFHKPDKEVLQKQRKERKYERNTGAVRKNRNCSE